MTNFKEKLQMLLQSKEEYRLNSDEAKANDGTPLLNKSLLSAKAREYDAELLALLQSDEDVKAHFFTAVALKEAQQSVLVFRLEAFLNFINNREFLPDSYTAYRNRIGLALGSGAGADYLANRPEVVLNFPYKDCVLEGGQTKEDQKRAEVFYNETLAPDQINRLFDKKVFVNWKRYYVENGEIKTDDAPELQNNDNLIIKGNNLVVLHSLNSLKQRFAGKVQLIYIDPPFNTETDSFKYNDKFTHSTWLVFMKNRLEIAKQLLSDTGLIYIHIDHNEAHYLKVLCDEVFDRKRFVNEVIWGYRIQGVNKSAWPKKHDNIYIYCKSDNYKFFSEKEIVKYEKPFIDTQMIQPDLSTINDSDKKKIIESILNNKPLPDKFKGKLFNKYFAEVFVRDVWDHDSTKPIISGSNEFRDFRTQKPEGLLKRIIESATDVGDIVLDFFSGSGTTAAVANKLNRQYIALEQIENQVEIMTKRLKDVINGDQTGISKSVNWQGGGSFITCELANDAQTFRNEVARANDSDALKALLQKVKNSSYLACRVDRGKLDEAAFGKLSAAEQKRLLTELVDANCLYINYSDIDSGDYQISEADKRINRLFYGE